MVIGISSVARCDVARRDVTRRGMSWRGKSDVEWGDAEWRGVEGRDVAWHDGMVWWGAVAWRGITLSGSARWCSFITSGTARFPLLNSSLLFSLFSIKAAKYEMQKPSTCRATLFRCKFGSMFPAFHLAWSTWSATKAFVAGWRNAALCSVDLLHYEQINLLRD